MNNASAIVVEGLFKQYGSVEAVRGIDFEVHAGEVFGLLGPNGAGKTTTVEILEGIRPRSAGSVRVLGFDPDKQKNALKDRIGVCLQSTNLPDKIRVIEALELFAALYSRTLDPAGLLKRLELEEKRNAFYSTLSGGQKQRLAIALALRSDWKSIRSSRNSRPKNAPSFSPRITSRRPSASATAWPSSIPAKSSPSERRVSCRSAAQASPPLKSRAPSL
jgi:ABC-type sugar transport system ATPase subunit